MTAFDMRTPEALLSGLDPQALLDVARGVLEPELDAVAREAKSLCPVRTGALRESICVRMAQEGASGEIVAGRPYAACVELGSASHAARPFLYPAFMARREGMTERIARAVLRRAENGGDS